MEKTPKVKIGDKVILNVRGRYASKSYDSTIGIIKGISQLNDSDEYSVDITVISCRSGKQCINLN